MDGLGIEQEEAREDPVHARLWQFLCQRIANATTRRHEYCIPGPQQVDSPLLKSKTGWADRIVCKLLEW